MTIYQEPKDNRAERLNSETSSSGTSNLQNLESELESARHRLEHAESIFEAADEAAFNAAEAADQGDKAYQANLDQLQALRAEEDSMRTATELAGALAEDASSIKTNSDANYSDLLSQAMTALITVSSNAKQELEEKQQQRIRAEYNDLRLRVEAASANLSAYMASRRRDNAEYERLQAHNQFNLKELQYKLALTRSELTHKLDFIAEQRALLDDTLTNYYAAISEAERLTAEDERHKSELDELQQHLSSTSAEIIPYETLVNDLKHEEAVLYDTYNKATRNAEDAYQQQNQAAEALQVAIQAEEAQNKDAEQKLSALAEANQKRIRAAEDDLSAVQAALVTAQDLADQAQVVLRGTASRNSHFGIRKCCLSGCSRKSANYSRGDSQNGYQCTGCQICNEGQHYQYLVQRRVRTTKYIASCKRYGPGERTGLQRILQAPCRKEKK